MNAASLSMEADDFDDAPLSQRTGLGKAYQLIGEQLPKLLDELNEALATWILPLAEQTRIVAEVERRLSVVAEVEAVVSTNLQRATRLRQSILQKVFTGKLV
jgi:hypothetical protein